MTLLRAPDMLAAEGTSPEGREERSRLRPFLSHPANRVLVGLLIASLALRVAMSVAMWPTYFDTGDVWPHVVTADGDLFGNPIGPAGYAMFLRLLRPLSSSVAFPVLVQHAIGLACVLAAFDAMVRLGVSRWLSLLPAAAIGLSLDQVLIEHFLMTDALFGFLLVFAFWLIVRAHGAERSTWWLVAAGVALGAAVTVRFAGFPVIAVTAVGATLLLRGQWARRLLGGAAVVAGALAALVPYHSALYVDKGRLSPTASSGWSLYTRVAPFADCSRFVPPQGTAHLCEASDPDDRPGPDYYAWDAGPARATYPDFIYGNRELRAWARAAIAAQPADYAKTVTRDVIRYYTPIGPARDHRDGLPMARITGDAPDVAYEKGIEDTFERYYDDTAPTRQRWLLTLLGRLQPILRFGTPLLLASVIAAVLGAVLLRGQARIWTLYAAGASSGVIGMSALAVGYVWRYALPVLPLAAMSVVLAISGLRARALAKDKSDSPDPVTGA